MRKVKAPPVGVYADVPFGDYLAWDAVSQSQLKELQRSPAHLRASLEAPDDDNDALRMGRAVHCAVLEPHRFALDFAVLPEGHDGRTKAGKELWADVVARGATPLKFDQAANITGMAAALRAHAAAGMLLASAGPAELSLVWRDPATGVLCKARHDKHAHAVGGGVILDVKSTTDASAREFERTVFNFAYHRQGAFYIRGARALELPVEHYAILAVEKEPPFAVAVYRLNEAAIDAGDQEVGALLSRYEACRARNVWPAYPETVQDLALPDWAWGVSDRMAATINAERGE